MKKQLILSAILIIFASCTQKNAEQTPQQFDFNANVADAFYADRLQRIDTAFQHLIDEEKMPHCVLFVAHKGRVVHYKAYGWRDVENRVPCQTDDIFRIASQTKAIAIVGLMTLFEEGKFQLDEPIKKYIPTFANPQVIDSYNSTTGIYTTRPAKRDITIRDLLTHTSGIAYEGIYGQIAHKANVLPFFSLRPVTLEEMVNKIATLPLAHEPGESFSYGMSTDVLGRLAEILSGQDIYSFLKERVLDPLGMEDTHFYLPENKVARLVKLHAYSPNGTWQVSTDELHQTFPYSGAKTLCSTGSGMCGTILDYAKFCQMILNGGEFNGQRILGRKTLEMMQKNGVGTMRGKIGFGMAWDVFTPENAHNTIVSEGSMRWGGKFVTDYIIDPKENLLILMYANILPNNRDIDPKTLAHNVVYQALK